MPIWMIYDFIFNDDRVNKIVFVAIFRVFYMIFQIKTI